MAVVLVFHLGCGEDEPGSGDSGGETMAPTTGGETSAESSEGGSSSGGDEIDADAIKMMADGYTGFEKINATASASQHGNAATVNFWVPSEFAAMYRMVDPAAPAAIAFPEGTLVVKEHLDDTDTAAGYTMMYKGPAGTNAEASDWWFARVGADGELKENGAVGFCIACHTGAQESDFIYGVPLDNRP
jgi:hypothetical protein